MIFIISTSIPYLIICICYVQIVRTFKCSKRKVLQVTRITIYNRLLVYWQGGSSGRPSCHEEELSQMVSLLQSLALECLSQRNQNARNILKEAGNHRAPSSCRLSLLGVCNGAGTRSDLDTLQKFVERMVMTMATMVMRNEDGNMTTVHTRSSLSSRSRSGDRGSAGWTSWLYWSCRHLQITTYIWSWLSVTLIWLITSSTLLDYLRSTKCQFFPMKGTITTISHNYVPKILSINEYWLNREQVFHIMWHKCVIYRDSASPWNQ